MSYWYNTLTRRFFRITSSLSDKIALALSKNQIECLPDYIVSKLKSGGFIVDKKFDELAFIREKKRQAIFDKNYFLIILPTLNCNYHCWYCIQDHIESKMDENTLENIKLHIDYMINVEKIKSLHLDWFGGEPFLYFNEIISPISLYAQQLCIKAGIPFFNSSTTNGFFLSNEVIDKCSSLDFKHFQITLDGNKKFHDKVKFQKNCESTFSHVLININKLISKSKDTVVYLRINYTHKNVSEGIVEEINVYIDPNNRSKIVITPRKVWQEDVKHDFHATLIGILDKFKESGYRVEYWNPVMEFIPCYVNKKYYNAINFNGNLIKCTACNDLYDPNAKGSIQSDGSIEWHNDFETNCIKSSFENERCLNCNKLPICMGLCPREHLNKQEYCKEDVLDYKFEDSIVDFIDRNY